MAKRYAAAKLAEWFEQNPKGYIVTKENEIVRNVCVPESMLQELLKEHNEIKARAAFRKQVMKD